jgi:hypothetical protein
MKPFFELMLVAKKKVTTKIREYKDYFTPRNEEEAEAAGALITVIVTVFFIAFGFDILAYFW